MSYLHRVTPNKATSQNIEAIYNEKGQMLDANTKEVLVQGQIDKGHKHGYEEQAMRVCAERCHMTQKEYNKMMQNPKLYQFESSHNNRSHKFESKDRMEQLHKCFEVIRDYKGKNRNKAHDKYGKSDFTFSNKSKTTNFGHSQNTVVSDKSQNSHSSYVKVRYYVPIIFIISHGKSEYPNDNTGKQEEEALVSAKAFIKKKVSENRLGIISGAIGNCCNLSLMRELTGIDTDNRLIKIDTEISLNKFLDYTKVIIHNWPQICRHHLDLDMFSSYIQ